MPGKGSQNVWGLTWCLYLAVPEQKLSLSEDSNLTLPGHWAAWEYDQICGAFYPSVMVLCNSVTGLSYHEDRKQTTTTTKKKTTNNLWFSSLEAFSYAPVDISPTWSFCLSYTGQWINLSHLINKDSWRIKNLLSPAAMHMYSPSSLDFQQCRQIRKMGVGDTAWNKLWLLNQYFGLALDINTINK